MKLARRSTVAAAGGQVRAVSVCGLQVMTRWFCTEADAVPGGVRAFPPRRSSALRVTVPAAVALNQKLAVFAPAEMLTEETARPQAAAATVRTRAAGAA